MPHVRSLSRLLPALLAALLVPPSPAAAVEPPGLPTSRAAAPVPGLSYLSFGVPDGLRPVGDVDRNGSQDLLEVRYRRSDSGRPTAVQLAVRGGTSGRAAWSRELRVPEDHDLSAFPATVGRPAVPGVVLSDQRLTSDGVQGSLRLTALDGRTGRVLWSRLDLGRAGDARSGTQPRVLDDLDGALLVVREQTTYGRTVDDPGSGTLRPLRLDLADGSVTGMGPLAVSERGVPSAFAVPDVTGDGQRDVAVLAPGATGSLQVRSGADGTPVWSTGALELWPDAQALPVGVVTGATVAGRPVGDVALSTGRPLRADSSRVPGARGEVLLLRGPDGTVALRRAGDQPVALRAAGRPPVPALGVETLDEASAPDGAATATRVVSAYRPDGTLVHAATGTVTAPGDGRPARPGDGPVAFSQTIAVGDLDRDGAQEVYSRLAANGTGDYRDRRDWLDGATGARLPVSQRAEPLLGHLSSHGDDLVELAPGNGVTVTGVSGRTGRGVFRRVLARGASLAVADARAVPVAGSACDDVAVTANGPRDDVAAVLRSDGTVRWSLRGPAGGAALRQPVRGTGRSSLPCG